MKAKEVSSILNALCYSIERGRQLGNTTSLINALKLNDNAVLVCANYFQMSKLQSEHPKLKDRIVSFHDFDKATRGRSDFFPLFDNFALSQIFAETNKKVKLLEEVNSLLEKIKDEL